MKLRNKRLVTALVAIFTVVFIAGSAFAFSGNGPLEFRGTANVEASLQLEIVDYEVVRSYGLNPEVAITGDNRVANFSVNFDQPRQRAEFKFTVENTGTMPAHFTGADFADPIVNLDHNATIDLELFEDLVVRYAWGQEQAWMPLPQEGLVLNVGEQIVISVMMDFFHQYPPSLQGFDGSFINGYVENTLTLSYNFPLSTD